MNRNCMPTPPGRNVALWISKICCLLLLQVLYRTSGQNNMNVLNTDKTTAELLLPFNEDYIIEVKATTEGGDGTSSDQILIPRLASTLKLNCCCFVMCLCSVLNHYQNLHCTTHSTETRLCLCMVMHY